MSRLKNFARFLRDNLESARRGNRSFQEVYERNPLAFLGDTGGPHRDRLAWQPVIDWAPVEEALSKYSDWTQSVSASPEELRQLTRREVRGQSGGEMRVLAAPSLLRRKLGIARAVASR